MSRTAQPGVARWRALLWASRPRTLPAAAAPVVVGCAVSYAERGFRAGPALAALAGALLLQIGANFVNDVLDFERGADTAARTGPLRVTQAGYLAPRQVKRAAAGVFALATLCGVYLALVAGWPVIAIGLVSIAAAVAYTGGPYPLAHHGLGEIFVILFFGFVAVAGTAFVQLGRAPVLAWAAAAPVGALAAAILVVNNVRDIETDRMAGRRTLAVRWGRRAGVIEFALCFFVGAAAPVAMVIAGLGSAWLLLPLAATPFSIPLIRALARREGPALNETLAATARFLLLYSALLAAGIVIGRMAR